MNIFATGIRIEGHATSREATPPGALARNGEPSAFRHCGFLPPMNALRDTMQLGELRQSGRAPWRTWG
ncbi:MAG: hypothetical protein P4M07_10920 [Xanthobacteraceae bacterium]|nr:hypothetical protein [Xanthobacteraceae bacterium]